MKKEWEIIKEKHNNITPNYTLLDHSNFGASKVELLTEFFVNIIMEDLKRLGRQVTRDLATKLI